MNRRKGRTNNNIILFIDNQRVMKPKEELERKWSDFEVRSYHDGDLQMHSRDDDVVYSCLADGKLVGMQCNCHEGTQGYNEIMDACDLIYVGFKRLRHAVEKNNRR